MSKITNDGLTRSGTGTACFIAVPIWQQWASVKGLRTDMIDSHLMMRFHTTPTVSTVYVFHVYARLLQLAVCLSVCDALAQWQNPFYVNHVAYQNE